MRSGADSLVDLDLPLLVSTINLHTPYATVIVG